MTTNSSRGDLNTTAIAMVTFVSAVLVFATIVFLVVVFYKVEDREELVKEVGQRYQEFSQLQAEQTGHLADYGLLDREKQRYAIPISRAMELTVQRRRENPLGPPGTPAVDTEEDTAEDTKEVPHEP